MIGFSTISFQPANFPMVSFLRGALVLFSITGLTLLTNCKERPAGRSGTVTVTGSANIGGPFELINQNGQTVTDADFAGRPLLIYFGFTYCPDICPTSLQQMGRILDVIDPKGEIFQPVFISVDPQRDTPQTLALYVTNAGFPKNLIGLTGSPPQIEAAKKAYKMYSAKVDDPGSQGGYTVDHLSVIYLMGPDGKFVDVFTHNTLTEDIIKRLRAYQKTL